MSFKIGLIGDIHATVGPLLNALNLLEQEGVDLVLCVGDIAGYGTELEQCIELLNERGCVAILGNHDVWHIEKNGDGLKKSVATFFTNLPAAWEATIEGKRVFAVHASPPDSMDRGITLLDQFENIMPEKRDLWASELAGYGYDALAVGHTHQVFGEMLGKTLVVNPGSTKFNNTCATLRVPDLDFRIFSLLGKTARKVWHWGMMT
jgi:putative phosphoesterase